MTNSSSVQILQQLLSLWPVILGAVALLSIIIATTKYLVSPDDVENKKVTWLKSVSSVVASVVVLSLFCNDVGNTLSNSLSNGLYEDMDSSSSMNVSGTQYNLKIEKKELSEAEKQAQAEEKNRQLGNSLNDTGDNQYKNTNDERDKYYENSWDDATFLDLINPFYWWNLNAPKDKFKDVSSDTTVIDQTQLNYENRDYKLNQFQQKILEDKNN